MSWKSSLFWTTILMILIEPYMEYAIAGIMNMHHYGTKGASDGFSNFCGFISMFIAFTIIPCIFYSAYAVPKEEFRRLSHKDKYGVIFLDIKSRTRWHAQYIGIMTLRRLIFLVIVFTMKYMPGPQIQAMLVLNLLYILYIGTKPMQTRYLNWLHFLEEMVIEACTLHMLCFLWVKIESVDTGYGWSMIIIMNLHFFIVCLWIAYLMGDIIRIFYKKISAIVKVHCVRRFGFRIGRKFKKEFNVNTEEKGERKVQ